MTTAIAGMRNVKVVPFPTSLSTQIRPPWSSMKRLARVSPSPVGWRPYFSATLDRPRVLSERKTGLKQRGVAPVRLAQDERGWLRIA